MELTESIERKAEAGFAGAHGSASLSATMSECVNRIRSHCGIITRYPGGFWCIENEAGETVAPTYGTSTVEALVRREALEYCEWKQSHGRQFPIKARLTPNSD